MVDATILREAARRIKRGFARVPRQYCPVCDQNAGYHIDEVLRMMSAIAEHAEGVGPKGYVGIYLSQATHDAIVEKISARD